MFSCKISKVFSKDFLQHTYGRLLLEVVTEIILKNSCSKKFFSIFLVKMDTLLYMLFRAWVMSLEWRKYVLKILSKIILCNFTVKVTNLLYSFCFITRPFNQTNSNRKQTPLELSFLTGMSTVYLTSSSCKKENRILASQDNNVN